LRRRLFQEHAKKFFQEFFQRHHREQFTRRGHDWTDRFRTIAADAWNVNAGSAIVDGEVVVPSADGTTDFSVLSNSPQKARDHIDRRTRKQVYIFRRFATSSASSLAIIKRCVSSLLSASNF
jgi:hypothetical protein